MIVIPKRMHDKISTFEREQVKITIEKNIDLLIEYMLSIKLKIKLGIVVGIVLFVVGISLSMFSEITMNTTIGIDNFSDYPIMVLLQPILMGSGLCLVGIMIVLKFMARKNP